MTMLYRFLLHLKKENNLQNFGSSPTIDTLKFGGVYIEDSEITYDKLKFLGGETEGEEDPVQTD